MSSSTDIPDPPAQHRATYTARHADDSECRHKLTSRGKPRDPESGCTGRDHYDAACRCGAWTQTGTTRAALEYSYAMHARGGSRA